MTKREIIACIFTLIFAFIVWLCEKETGALSGNVGVEIASVICMFILFPFLPKAPDAEF